MALSPHELRSGTSKIRWHSRTQYQRSAYCFFEIVPRLFSDASKHGTVQHIYQVATSSQKRISSLPLPSEIASFSKETPHHAQFLTESIILRPRTSPSTFPVHTPECISPHHFSRWHFVSFTSHKSSALQQSSKTPTSPAATVLRAPAIEARRSVSENVNQMGAIVWLASMVSNRLCISVNVRRRGLEDGEGGDMGCFGYLG